MFLCSFGAVVRFTTFVRAHDCHFLLCGDANFRVRWHIQFTMALVPSAHVPSDGACCGDEVRLKLDSNRSLPGHPLRRPGEGTPRSPWGKLRAPVLSLWECCPMLNSLHSVLFVFRSVYVADGARGRRILDANCSCFEPRWFCELPPATCAKVRSVVLVRIFANSSWQVVNRPDKQYLCRQKKRTFTFSGHQRPMKVCSIATQR